MSDELRDERLERALDRRRRQLLGRELRLEREVAEAAGDDPAVGRLLPVVEAVAGVVRALEQTLRDRLRRDHLPARRDDRALERTEQAARVAVRRDEHLLGVELVERLDAMVLDDRDAGLRREHARAAERTAPAASPRRPDGRSPRESDRASEFGIATPPRSRPRRSASNSARISSRSVIVRGETQAAGPAERVAAEQLRADRGAPPSAASSSAARSAPSHVARVVVRHRAAAQREAAVAAARAFGDARARRGRERAFPASANVSAAEMPVIPAPTISTSGCATSTAPKSGAASSVSHQDGTRPMLRRRQARTTAAR